MRVTKSLSVLTLLGGIAAVQACTDNPAAYQGILGPDRAPTEEPSSGGGSGGNTPTGGTAPTGGTSGDGGMGAGGAAAGSGGAAGSAGAADSTMNPPPHPDFMPPCFLTATASGDEILKGVPCTSADPRMCYRPCGPAQVGWKLEECRAG